MTTSTLCRLATLCMMCSPTLSFADELQQSQERKPSTRQKTVLESISAAELAEYLQKEGYAAQLVEKDDAEDLVEMKVNGRRTVAFIFDERTTIEFYLGFNDQTLSLAAINQWNHSNRVSRISINEDGDAQLSLRLHLNGGVTPNWIVIHASAFRQDCEAFEKVMRDK